MDKIIKFRDNKNFDFYFKKYWNGFVESDTPKIHFSLEEFFDKMDNEKYIKTAINKMEFQERIVSCQYIKRSETNHGFANFFLIKLPEKYKICNGASYYFIYKSRMNKVDDLKNDFFIPKRRVYTDFKIDPDSLDYLANFAIPINERDFIYCLKYKKVIRYDEIFNQNVIKM
ncbi:MAG: hypothetical protein B6I28_00415 [Fusobacteriia bacterium 4572_132]|nr:MAG: hypothetical protein B6I28_00415 [Fusobacteriia bacterium 4572_132]